MKKYAIEFKWAVIFTMVALGWIAVEKSMGWYDELIADHALYTNFFAIVAIIMYVLALIDKRENFYEGVMSWKNAFRAGLVISIIIALLTPLSQWITHELIAPEYFPHMIEYAVESGQSTQTEAESYFNLKSYILQSSVFALIVGVLTSAVVAFFVKKKA